MAQRTVYVLSNDINDVVESILDTVGVAVETKEQAKILKALGEDFIFEVTVREIE